MNVDNRLGGLNNIEGYGFLGKLDGPGGGIRDFGIFFGNGYIY